MGLSIVVYAGAPSEAHPILATRDPQVIEVVRRLLLERLTTDTGDQLEDNWGELFGEDSE
jgi:hypothetical protein